MAFQYAYSLDGGSIPIAKDYPIDTVANYKTGAGTNDHKSGDLVFLNAGLVRRVTAATATGTALGVSEGGEFTGLVQQGQPYAATNAAYTADVTSATRFPNGMSKVKTDKSAAVYRVPVNQAGAKQTADNTDIGKALNIILDAAGDQKVDLNLTTVPHVRVVDIARDGKTVFVTIV